MIWAEREWHWLTVEKPRAAGNSSTNPYPDVKSQKAFEKGLIEKTAKQTGDIILYDNRIVLYKLESDVMIYIVGSVDENEILLYNTILAIRDSLHLLFKYVHILIQPLLCTEKGGEKKGGRPCFFFN